MSEKITKTEEEWKKELTDEEFRIMRKHGTEPAFTGKYWDLKDQGTYKCAACGNELFNSATKYDSGSGWPSFYEPISRDKIGTQIDRSLLAARTEVHCDKCGAHLGHVFPDGPEPTGQRYCINSVSLKFEKED